MFALRPLALATVALLLTPALATADGQTPPPPTLQGSFDPETDLLTLAWQPGGEAPEGTVHRVYQDGVMVEETPALTFEADLSGWSGEPRDYTVTTTTPGGVESAHSEPYLLRAEEPSPPPPPQPAPTLQGQYDSGTQALTLSWSAEAPAGSEYGIYLNGAFQVQVPETSLVIDLSGWVEGVREYAVTVIPPAGDESAPSEVFRILANVQVPQNCPVASVSVYTKPPGAQYTIYDECLPG